VADVGAGSGYYSVRLAEMVGPGGRVFAEDISLSALGPRMEAYHLPNIQVIQGAVDDPKLPADSLAGVLVVNAYHHFEQYRAMNSQILRALRPGGRFVVLDYSWPADRSLSREEQLKKHQIDPSLVRAELEQAGFGVVRTEDPFVRRMPEKKNAGTIANADMWLITAIRPR
jgi:ubiquinone/menaquinone biosynthesis C-methylase UbiE